jgi:hypothetical protein
VVKVAKLDTVFTSANRIDVGHETKRMKDQAANNDSLARFLTCFWLVAVLSAICRTRFLPRCVRKKALGEQKGIVCSWLVFCYTTNNIIGENCNCYCNY